jgi:soluble lytic murein transglycosylase-like protein
VSSTTDVEPHTPIRSNTPADPDQWDGLLNRLGQKYNVPPLFLKAVMLIESGGRPDAIGDGGHSVGLFQLHDQGYGHGMGDLRFDPEANADRAARGLAEAWHAGERAGYTGEYALRAAYNYSFNPGGGFAYQGDALVRTYNRLLAEQGLPGLA